MLRKCNDCGLEAHTEEELTRFLPDKQSKYGRRNLCGTCGGKRANSNPKAKDWKTNHQTKKRYGCDVETYEARMATSDCCEVCGSEEQLCYDHCHDTMKFRGVLCRACNRSIGQLGDTADALKKALDYLIERG